MADETLTETPPTTEIAPSGGILTRTDGTPSAPSDWRATLPPELQAEKSLADVPDVPTLARRFLDNHRAARNAIKLPGADAKPEEVTDFHRKLGVPDSPDKYETPPAPEGEAWKPEELAPFRALAHQLGLTPKQWQGLLGGFTEYTLKQRDLAVATEAKTAQAQRAQAIATLETKWGPKDGPMWKHHHARAEQAVRVLMADAPAAAVQTVVEQANDPEVAHAFALLADSLLERGYIGEDEAPSGLGAEAAQAKADEIRDASLKDPSHPLRNPGHPDHERVLKQYMEYQAVAAGPRGREIVTTVMR